MAHFVQWADFNRSADLPETTTSSIDHTDGITLPTTTGQMTNMSM